VASPRLKGGRVGVSRSCDVMRTPGPAARAILEIVDSGTGAMAPNREFLAARLKERGFAVERTALHHILRRLEDRGEIVSVKSPSGGVSYTRPRNLDRPSYRIALEDVPSLDIRRKSEWSEKKVKLRNQRAVRRWQDKVVERSGHDHRPNRRCPRCGTVTPEIRLTH
jgi:hypothetical protein